MEAFSLLKYWRGGGGTAGFVVGASGGGGGVGDSVVSSRATTIVTALAAQNAIETDDDEDGDDDGPFFDLEFAVPDEDEDEKPTNGEEYDEDSNDVESENDDEAEEEDDDGDGTDGEREFNFTLSSGSSNDRVDQNLPLSPSDDLFFKGRLVPIEPASLVLNGSELANSKPQFPVSFLKSATKFRVFMLGFKKSRMGSTEKEKNGEAASTESKQQPQEEKRGGDSGGGGGTKQSKLFTVKFKVEEVPIVSLFTRENSKNAKSSQKQNNNSTEEPASTVAAVTSATSDEKRFSKEVMHKYLKKVKPLYVRVSKRYGEKLRFSGQLSLGSALKSSAPPQPPPPPPPPFTAATAQKSSLSKQTAPAEKSQPETEVVEVPPASNVKSLKAAGLRVVCKHLGKSRSASAAVAAAPSAPVTSRRRDDSLLQQQDGIQSAILHCKRSFNASRDSDSFLLSRSVSDPSCEKALNSQANQEMGFQIS